MSELYYGIYWLLLAITLVINVYFARTIGFRFFFKAFSASNRDPNMGATSDVATKKGLYIIITVAGLFFVVVNASTVVLVHDYATTANNVFFYGMQWFYYILQMAYLASLWKKDMSRNVQCMAGPAWFLGFAAFMQILVFLLLVAGNIEFSTTGARNAAIALQTGFTLWVCVFDWAYYGLGCSLKFAAP